MAIGRSRSDCPLNPAEARALESDRAGRSSHAVRFSRNECALAEAAIDHAGVLLRRRDFYLHRSPKATIFISDEFECRPVTAGIHVCVARLRRFRTDGDLDFFVAEAGKPIPSRSIRITGRMTTIAEPTRVGGGFCCGERRTSGNTTSVPMGSPGRLPIEGHRRFNDRSDLRTICACHG
jgi:hypothetical protein